MLLPRPALSLTIASSFCLMATTLAIGQSLIASPPKPASAVRSEMLVTTQWLSENLKDPNVVVLCIAAGKSFYEESHIPGARRSCLLAFARAPPAFGLVTSRGAGMAAA